MKTLNVEDSEYERLQEIKNATGIMFYRLIKVALTYLEDKYKEEIKQYKEETIRNSPKTF